MALGDPEGEAALLLDGVLGGVDVVRPGEAVAAEGVVDGVVGGDGEGDGLGGVGAGEDEAAGGGGGGGVEVEGDVAVEVVGVDGAVAVELGDFEVGVGAEEIVEGIGEGMQPCQQLCGQDVLHNGEEA